MKTNFRLWIGAVLALSFVSVGWAYSFITNDSGQTLTWPAGTVSMQIMVDDATALSDGNTRATSIQAAMQQWNGSIASLQFSPHIANVGSGADHNAVNEIFFSDSAYGYTWDSNTLAITTGWSNGAQRTETDIIFNTAFNWDSYRGPLHENGAIDIQRVAFHELGHVLGLDHPDEHGQAVSAVMNSAISYIDSLQPDDISGAQSLYGIRQSAPTVISQPVNKTVYAGQNVLFNLTATGYPSPTYRWQRLGAGSGAWANLSDGGNYSATGTSALVISNPTTALTGDQFRCVVTNVLDSVTSGAATLTVLATTLPSITTQPVSTTVLQGNSVAFTAAATGVPAPTFQWQKNGLNISGATGVTYTIVNAKASDAGSYEIIASNLAGTATSNPAILTVIGPPIITSLSPVRQVLNPGQTLNLAVTATGHGILYYQWMRNGHPIDGASSNIYTRSDLTTRDTGYYFVKITDSIGNCSSMPIFITVVPTVTMVVAWGSNSNGQIAVPGGLSNAVAVAANNNTSMALKADGTVTVWGDTSYSQSVVPRELNSVTAIAAGTFHNLALKMDGTVVGWGDNAYQQSTAPAGLTNVVAIGAGFYFSVALKTDGTVVAWGDNSYGQTNVPAGLANVIGIATGNATVLAVKADGTVVAWGNNNSGQASIPSGLNNVVAVACGSSHSVALKVDGSVVAWGDHAYGQTSIPSGLTDVIAISACGVISQALKADGSVVAWGSSAPQVNVPTGMTDVVGIASGFNHALALRGVGDILPVITRQPLSQTVAAGGTVTFTTSASGKPAPTFHWRKNGVNINGATDAFLTLNNLQLADAGNYSVVAMNFAGSVSSDVAVLVVRDATEAPVFTIQPDSASVSPGVVVNFSVVVSGHASTTYQWQRRITGSAAWSDIFQLDVTGSQPALFPYSGMNSPVLQVQTDTTMQDYQFRCIATNFAGHSMSDAAMLTIDTAPRAPSFYTQPVSKGVDLGRSVSFTVEANGFPAPSFQWKKDGVEIAGANLKFYSLPFSAMRDAGIYTVVASNVFGSVESDPAMLTITGLATISIQPSILIVATGYSVTLTASVTGNPGPSIQWKKDGLVITGASGASYTIASATLSDAGVYTAVATNSLSTATSNTAVLTVVPSVLNASGVTADFDGDGQSDLIWQNTLTGERSFWLMNGTILKQGVSLGTFAPDWNVAAMGDFNQDGQPDVVWQNTLTGERSIWLMNGTSLAQGVDLGTYSIDWMIVATGDFNGDAQTDILVQNTITGERVVWLMNGTTKTSEVSLGVVATAWSIAGVGDMNGDGQLDLIWQNAATGERSVWLMNGTAMSSNVSLGNVAKQFQVVGTGDFNQDGKTDLVWTDIETGNRSIWLMNGLVRTSTMPLATVSLDWSVGRPIFITAQNAHADLNADGQTDIIWQNAATGERSVWLMNGTTKTSETSLVPTSTNWIISGTGDFNHDEKPDLVWTNTATGERTVWLMDGTTILSNVPLATISPIWLISAIGDFNYDGKPDLVWSNTVTGERSIWLMNGTVFGSGIALGTLSKTWSIATTADLNGDGKTDIIWQNTSTGECSVWLMNGGNFTAGVALDPLPVEWRIVGNGDFNGDGKADLLLQNTVTGERTIRLMNRTAFISSVSLTQFSTGGSIGN